MQIRRLGIQDIRSILNLEIDIPEPYAGWHVILGDNGSGKSSIIRALALALMGPEDAAAARQDWLDWIRKGAPQARVTVEVAHQAPFDKWKGTGRPTKTSFTLTVALRPPNGTVYKAGITPQFTGRSGRRTIWGRGAGWFCASFGPFRRFSGGDKEYDKLFYSNPGLARHLSAFGEDVALGEALQWLQALQFKRYENDDKATRLLDALVDFLRQSQLLPHGAHIKDITSEAVLFSDGAGVPVPVDQLSVFGYRVGARKSAKWCAASCAGADTWSMARGSGRGGGSKAPRREQEPRDKRIEELQRENVKLNEDLVRTIRDRDRWKRRSEHLEKQLDAARRAGRRQAAPFAKDRRQGRGGRPGRRPGAGYGRQGRRRRPPRVDETHAARVPKACPACGGAVEVARVAAQYQEDLPPVHPIVRRFDIEVGHCSQCRRRVQGRHRLQTSDALGAASVQLGPGAVSLAVELHTELGVPLAKVAHVLRTRFGVHVTPGGLARLLHRAARDAGPAYRELCRQVRNAPVVTPDETGWRVGAKPHWLWTCVTPETTVYAICPGRSFDDAATLLGTDYSGVLVRDGWVVYRCYKGLHQSCINHLANRCRKLREGHPRSPWGPAVLAVLRAGLAARDRCNAGEMSEHGLASVRGRLEARLGRLIDAPPRIPDAQRFANHLATEFPAVFLFLRDPSIDATNWRAEQAIRPAVVIRKVCGGNRTRQGADTQQVLSSVVRTARQRGLDLPRLITEMLRAREPVVPEAFGLPPPPA